MDLALPGLAIGWVDACSGGLEKFAANSTSEVREFSRVVRGSCVHRVVSASPSRPARPACPMLVDVRTRGGSGAENAHIREGIKGARIGAVVPVPGGCWFECSTVRPACPCALRGTTWQDASPRRRVAVWRWRRGTAVRDVSVMCRPRPRAVGPLSRDSIRVHSNM